MEACFWISVCTLLSDPPVAANIFVGGSVEPLAFATKATCARAKSLYSCDDYGVIRW